VALSKT